ncbi:Clavaminate synthase-like protein [Xylariaceae sp. FL0804]|nr:Clavaminate synthase-like protein [Xylariaceae sp. FL0804]
MGKFVIPTVDLEPFLRDPESAEAARVVEQVREACTTSGFFLIVNHGVPRALQDEVFAAAKTFFALPLEEKKATMPENNKSVSKNRGYEIIGSQALQADTRPDLKEGFYVGQHIPADDPRAKAHPQLMGPNVFPAGLADAELREPTERYYGAVFELSCRVMEVLARGLPYGRDVFGPFTSNDPVCSIRLLHYPPQPERDARQLGAGAHTDFGAITLLMQDGAGGLEVLNRDGGEDESGVWVPVTPNPDAYVVNIGDMLSLWTAGAYKSTVHRVINTSGTDRYSVPFFFDGNTDVKLAPLDGSKPPSGKAVITAEEHMLERFGTTYGRAEKQTAGAAS